MTADQLKVLGFGSFGYLTAYDLLQWCSPQLLIKQWNVNSDALQSGCSIAESEVISSLKTRYDLTAEFGKTGNVQAYGVAILGNANNVSVINVLVLGTNYTTAPTVNITGGGGSGATGTAILLNNAVSSVTVTLGGSGYTSAPVISFSGGQLPDTRSNLLVKILSLLAIRNILGNMENISDQMASLFKWADSTLKDIRNGQMNLPLPGVTKCVSSGSFLVCQDFKTLG